MALDDYLAAEVAADCRHGLVPRREALRRLGLLGVGGAAALTLLTGCGSDDTTATPDTDGASGAPSTDGAPTSTPTTTPGTEERPGENITFAGPRGDLLGVLGAPSEPEGAVLVVHENRGLTDHIRSIPTRLAADGYAALAIDLLSEEGGTAGFADSAEATAALGAASEERLLADLRAGLDELSRRYPDAALGVVGFCFGGGMVWRLLAAGEPRLAAAVPFYGPAPAAADYSGSPGVAVLGVYGELDERVNATMDAAGAALEAAALTHELRTFAGADHAFFNDTGGRYSPEAATAAYAAMLDWFATHLA